MSMPGIAALLGLALGFPGVQRSVLRSHQAQHKAPLTPLSLLGVRHRCKMSLLLSPIAGRYAEAGIQRPVLPRIRLAPVQLYTCIHDDCAISVHL